MKYIAYYRVSTQRQNESGLGLKAQETAVENYIKPENIYASFREAETGTNKKHRPELEKALKLCKEIDGTLIIAKLDRLARNVAFVSSLLDSKVKFKAVDMPDANELTIHIMAAIAEHEAGVIRKRIRDALAESDKKLGNPQNLTPEARKKGLDAILKMRRNNENRKRALSMLKALYQEGKTLQWYADQLNEGGFLTSGGKQFSKTQVSRLLKEISPS
jgi:DNA invertase Pin-like site-specific DNA recombinase